MGAGGIVNQRRAALLPAATDPSVFNFLTDAQKAQVDCIGAKDPMTTTEDDIKVLASLIHAAVHTG